MSEAKPMTTESDRKESGTAREFWIESTVRNTRLTDVRDFETEGFIRIVANVQHSQK